ncbi:VOC family protein [Mumia sp. zg.B21]|uniref:VOC family protein n=1 Tax=Mumia sp. zg.B21 TaxID=2855447 RepID=UPI001C6ECD16|nr:VOC family protein [Mumia sp. zg.B21]MBW9208665.1 VOC family protein [Mumia sp. zg.B21]
MENAGRIVALNHVGISVADLEAARRFWVEGLGATEHGAFGWPVGTTPADESLATEGTAADVVLLRTDAAFMELFAFSSPTPAVRLPGAPGVKGFAWAVTDADEAYARAVDAGGTPLGDHRVRCPDGTPVTLVAAEAPTGLVGVLVQVGDAEVHPMADVPGPVTVEVSGGADEPAARPVDLGVNHLCVDVEGIDAVRGSLDATTWHHPVTESSGGIAAVCYGTTRDGVLLELLESRSPDAFLSRTRLTHP